MEPRLYELWHLPQDTTDNAFAATAHATYHVTYARGNFPHIFQIPDPDLLIHYATFMTLRWRLRAVYSYHVQC